MEITKFKDAHKGKTILLVGNGSNLKDTPPEKFDYPSIGMNTIHFYDGWKPDYYVAVDRRLMNEFGDDVYRKFADIPKFIPKPKLLRWRGDNFYRFRNRTGRLYPAKPGENLWQGRIDADTTITWANVMHVAIKLAYFMGAKTILIIGMEHKKNNAQDHFWGSDVKGVGGDITAIFNGYKQLVTGLHENNIKIYNISKKTHVPSSVIPTDDAINWYEQKELIDG